MFGEGFYGWLMLIAVIAYFPIRLVISAKFDRVNASYIMITTNVLIGAGIVMLLKNNPEYRPFVMIVMALIVIQVVNLVALHISEKLRSDDANQDQS